MATKAIEKSQTRIHKIGWGILVVISALFVLNGVSWFFAGPGENISYLESSRGVPMEEFIKSYPAVEQHLARNARQLAVWMAAFGLLALVVALEGYRHETRWAWYATWILVAAPIAVGLVYLPGGELGFANIGLLAIAGITLLGQILAGWGLSRSVGETG